MGASASSLGTAELVNAAALLRTSPVPEGAPPSFWDVFMSAPKDATVRAAWLSADGRASWRHSLRPCPARVRSKSSR
jgi:hypothetical protein